jgi:arabinose-5-phosphate isomerase
METASEIAKKVFRIESREIANLSNYLTKDFDNTIQLIIASSGKLIISGMGKSGIIGKKIAASLASTGTPSFFLHPGEAYHGDLGMIEPDDVLLLISNSGETDEVLKIIPFLKNNGNSIISMSGNPDSTLAKNSNFHLNIQVSEEACPLQLAPTSSTTTTLVMGDAIVVALMGKRDFQPESFARFHPGGSLGKKLLTKIGDIMSKKIPSCKVTESFSEVVHMISKGKQGLVIVTTSSDQMVGVITDGDIRRNMDSLGKNAFDRSASEIMNVKPLTINSSASIVDVNEKFSSNKVSSLIVVDSEEKPIGMISQHQTI